MTCNWSRPSLVIPVILIGLGISMWHYFGQGERREVFSFFSWGKKKGNKRQTNKRTDLQKETSPFHAWMCLRQWQPFCKAEAGGRRPERLIQLKKDCWNQDCCCIDKFLNDRTLQPSLNWVLLDKINSLVVYAVKPSITFNKKHPIWQICFLVFGYCPTDTFQMGPHSSFSWLQLRPIFWTLRSAPRFGD